MRRETRRKARPAWSYASRCPETGKVRHLTRADATYWRRRLHQGDPGINAYECSHCGFWHVGHLHASGTRHPHLRCTVDTLPVFDSAERAAAYAERLGPEGVVATCGDHWHVCLLPAA
ncbi:hypothetical protein [Nonomuraea dietziae]|uniref:hypothetical protein n=1 Tax=Nonomuraea dietziae TaxID=65515 RepID=UPI0033EBF5F7